MGINWKALKAKKEQELPAVVEADRKVGIGRKKRINRITDQVERAIFDLCEKQKAGTTETYSIPHSEPTFKAFIDNIFGEDGWKMDEEIKLAVREKIVDRLTAQGIDCKPVKGWHQVRIKLP